MTWSNAALGEVAVIERKSVSPSQIPSGSRYVGLEHIESGGASLTFGEVANGELASNKFCFGPNHILFGKLRPYLAKIVCPDFSGICSTDILPIAPGGRIDKGYLLHFLRRPQTIDWASARSTGVNLPRLSPGELETLEIPLPPLDEQRRIAAILDKADALRRKRKRSIELLDRLAHSKFSETFVSDGDPEWSIASVEELAIDIRTGPFGSQLLHSEFVDQGVAVLGIDNAVDNEFRWGERRFISETKYAQLKRYRVRPGDVLITIMGTCGRCAIVPDDIPIAINTKHLCCITLNKDKCLPEFLKAAFLHHPMVLKQLGVQAKGAVMPGLNMGIIKSLSFPLPPIELQAAFVGMIHRLRSIRSQQLKGKADLDLLFSSLQHRAFSGQL